MIDGGTSLCFSTLHNRTFSYIIIIIVVVVVAFVVVVVIIIIIIIIIINSAKEEIQAYNGHRLKYICINNHGKTQKLLSSKMSNRQQKQKNTVVRRPVGPTYR